MPQDEMLAPTAPLRAGSLEYVKELLQTGGRTLEIAERFGIDLSQYEACIVKYMEGSHYELGFVCRDVRYEMGQFQGRVLLYRNGRVDKSTHDLVQLNVRTGHWDRFPD
jgi:hypothetical protein